MSPSPDQTIIPPVIHETVVHRPTVTRINPPLSGVAADLYDQLGPLHADKWGEP